MEAQQISHYADLEKLSGIVATPDPAAGPQANAQMWKWIIGAAGAGMLGRAGLGIMHMMQPKSKLDPAPSFQRVGVAMPQKEDEEKIAGMSEVTNWLEKLTAGSYDNSNWWRGSQASTASGVPNLYAMGVPAAVASGVAGWKGVDMIADNREQQAVKSELEKAKEDYQHLLSETMSKHSADAEGIEAELDELAELVAGQEKQAFEWWKGHNPADWLGRIGGGTAAYAIIAALASGKLSYDYFRKRNQKGIAEDALQRRSKERSGGVSPIYMQPAAPKGV
jgi:hypothetical protein